MIAYPLVSFVFLFIQIMISVELCMYKKLQKVKNGKRKKINQRIVKNLGRKSDCFGIGRCRGTRKMACKLRARVRDDEKN